MLATLSVDVGERGTDQMVAAEIFCSSAVLRRKPTASSTCSKATRRPLELSVESQIEAFEAT